MRADARSLLDRLGRSDFAYKEFADRFSDLELWPLFEALLKDPRLYQPEFAAATGLSTDAVTTPNIAAARPVEPLRPETAPAPERTKESVPEPVLAAPAKETLADLFSRYEKDGAAEERSPEDVRSMLRRLSDNDARGVA